MSLQPSASVRAYFGWRLRHWRLTNGLTQMELGDQLGYDHSYLSKVESGDRWPPPDLPERADRLLGTGGELATLWPLVERERRQAEQSFGSRADAVAAIERLLLWAGSVPYPETR